VESINDEVANVCLVANEDEVDSTFSSNNAYDEFKTVYGEVLEDLENTTKKYFKMKSSFKTISKEINELKIINKNLIKEIEQVKKIHFSKTQAFKKLI